MFIKITIKESKTFKKIQIIQSISLFRGYIKKGFTFLELNGDASRIQGVCNMIYISFGSSLCKV